MDRDEVAARRLGEGQPRICVNKGLVYLVPNGFDILDYDSDGQLVVSDGCQVRTIRTIGHVKGG
jgi:hypothetical protein